MCSPLAPRTPSFHKFLGTWAGDPRDGDFGRYQQSGQTHEQQHGQNLQDDISVLHQDAPSDCHSPSNRRCRPNIRRSSSASAWS